MEVGFLAAMTAEGGGIAEIARATEAAGFDSLWIPESGYARRDEDDVSFH